MCFTFEMNVNRKVEIKTYETNLRFDSMKYLQNLVNFETLLIVKMHSLSLEKFLLPEEAFATLL